MYSSSASAYIAGSAFATIMGVFAFLFVIAITIGIISIISMWVIYKKANKPGWAAIIPIYNTWVLLEIAHLPWWYLILMFVPLANIFALIMTNVYLAKSFGKSVAFAVGLIFLPYIFYPILAFSSASYQG